jgi:acyl-CoA synthetase (AMP-forming)/AMP-acid ligase II
LDAAAGDEEGFQGRNQGVFSAGVEARLVGEGGNVLPHDGKAVGELKVRGPWVAASDIKNPYMPDPEARPRGSATAGCAPARGLNEP